MPNLNAESGCKRLNLSSTNNTALQGVDLVGVFISSASGAPTLKIEDTKGVIMNTMTPVAGQYYKLPCRTVGQVTITIANAVDCTIFYT